MGKKTEESEANKNEKEEEEKKAKEKKPPELHIKSDLLFQTSRIPRGSLRYLIIAGMTILGMVGLLAAIRSRMAPSPKKSVEIKNKLPNSTSIDQATSPTKVIIDGLPATSSNKPSTITEPTPRAPSRENDDGKVPQKKLLDMPSSHLSSAVSPTSSNKKISLYNLSRHLFISKSLIQNFAYFLFLSFNHTENIRERERTMNCLLH